MAGSGHHHHHHHHDDHDCCHHTPKQTYGPIEPEGELVTVFSAANPNYLLTARGDGAVLAFKNVSDLSQRWIKVDVGPGKLGFVDRDGQPGFILVSKATGAPLKHGHAAADVVTTHTQVYSSSALNGGTIWTLGKKDEGHGYRGVRAVTNITLNLEVDHADKAHGGVRDGNRLLLSHWKSLDSFKWKIEPLVPAGI